MTSATSPANSVPAAWGIAVVSLKPLGDGLINETWLLTAAHQQQFVLQKVNPVFPAAVNIDIDVVVRRLAEAGLETPFVLPTLTGSLWLESGGDIWRLLTWLPGASLNSLTDAEQARQAGHLLGRFHRALDGLVHDFANPRLGVHDTAGHLQNLHDALQAHRNHERYAEVSALADEIFELAEALPSLPATPDRVVHGDPKINNMLFDEHTGTAKALVDLDTIGRMPLPLELGDAFRSWCNPAGENRRSGVFSPELFRGGLDGYAEATGDWISPLEQAAIVNATLTIIVELATRFCTDALNEKYFGWDSSRFATRGEHNQVRASGQLSLARSCLEQRGELEDHVLAAFA